MKDVIKKMELQLQEKSLPISQKFEKRARPSTANEETSSFGGMHQLKEVRTTSASSEMYFDFESISIMENTGHPNIKDSKFFKSWYKPSSDLVLSTVHDEETQSFGGIHQFKKVGTMSASSEMYSNFESISIMENTGHPNIKDSKFYKSWYKPSSDLVLSTVHDEETSSFRVFHELEHPQVELTTLSLPCTKSQVTSSNSAVENVSHRFLFLGCKDFQTKYKVVLKLGKGCGGTVYRGVYCNDADDYPRNVAVKVIERKEEEGLFMGKLQGIKVPCEILLLKKASTDNKGVVQLLDWYELNGEYMFVMESDSCWIELTKYLSVFGKQTEQKAKQIFGPLVKTVQKCHENKVVHRDIKLGNILINPTSLETKLIDFDCSSELQEENHPPFHYTPKGFPPECFHPFKGYNGPLLDAWLLGCVLFQLVKGEENPFNNIKNANNCRVFDFKTIEHLSFDLQELIRALLNDDDNQRLQVEEIYKSKWLSKEL